MRGFISTVTAISLVGIGFTAGVYYSAHINQSANATAQAIVHMAHTSHKVRYLELLQQNELDTLQEALRLHVACEFEVQASSLRGDASLDSIAGANVTFTRFQALADDISCPPGMRDASPGASLSQYE